MVRLVVLLNLLILRESNAEPEKNVLPKALKSGIWSKFENQKYPQFVFFHIFDKKNNLNIIN